MAILKYYQDFNNNSNPKSIAIKNFASTQNKSLPALLCNFSHKVTTKLIEYRLPKIPKKWPS